MPEKNLVIRIRTKKGMARVQTLNNTSTFAELKSAIAAATEIDVSFLKILKGYPPSVLTCSNESSSLASLSIADGELLTVEESTEKCHTSSVLSSSSNKLETSESKKASSEILQTTKVLGASNQIKGLKVGVMVRKVVPANNSCLFTSVYYVMENGKLNLDCQQSMREFIAKTVSNDPIMFNEAILGKKNETYCTWIKNPSSWGGCIELMVLSKYYKKEICVADIRTGRIDRFGEDQSYMTRVFIIYDGIHFDPLHLQLENNKVQTIFSTQDDAAMLQAGELADEAKKNRQFTNVENFKLRCLVCQTPLSGQVAAQEHAEKTGHINFGEV